MVTKTVKVLLIVLVLCIIGCSLSTQPATNIQMPAMFSSNMVLQQGLAVPFWGTANPKGKVTISIDGIKKSTTVSQDSSWRIEFPAFEEYGGPYTVEITGSETITFKNVMVGEVWLCSGQSNMEMQVGGVLNFEQEIANANHPDIRLLTVGHNIQYTPCSSIDSKGWLLCSPETIPVFSATAYFFGRHLKENLNIPIGLIHSSWGGTPAETWTSMESLLKLEDFKDLINITSKEGNLGIEARIKQFNKDMENWENTVEATVLEAQNKGPKWFSPEYDTHNWKLMDLPGIWENAGHKNFDGVAWYRKEIELSLAQASKEAVIHLGPINDFDVTYVNGIKIGADKPHDKRRVYTIPASVLKPGKNLIAVRVMDIGGNGGFWGSPTDMKLVTTNGIIRLDGLWKFKTFLEFNAFPPIPLSPKDPNKASLLYNGMIHPLVPYAIRGAIWYQGESNATRAYQYRDLFKTMITDWRSKWNLGDFPFIFTQLANFKEYKNQPGDDDWAELREAQVMALDLPNTGMAVTIDIGDANDIHPKNKQDVGKRLAFNALNKVYGKNDIVPSGPLYKSFTVEGNKIRIQFEYARGLNAKGGKLTGFAIAGENKNWIWADAVIDGETVVVSSPPVQKPVAVRYAWQTNPRCNLYNGAGLPASPFRTDTWPGITLGKK